MYIEMMKVLDYNNDGVVNLDDIYDVIRDFMKKEEKSNRKGLEKLESVKLSLKLYLSIPIYQKYEPMIEAAIEFIHKVYFVKKRCCLKK